MDKISGNAFGEIREILGYSINDAACALGVTRAAVWQWEEGKRKLPASAGKWLEERSRVLEMASMQIGEFDVATMRFLPAPENMNAAFIMGFPKDALAVLTDNELRRAISLESIRRKVGIAFYGIRHYSAWLAKEQKRDGRESRDSFLRMCAVGGQAWLDDLLEGA